MKAGDLRASTEEIAAGFAAERRERQQRRHLDPADFELLAQSGYLLTGVPADRGGLWEGVASTSRLVAEALRALAKGDASVALVSSMHPAVLSFWLATPEVEGAASAAWGTQLEKVTDAARAGSWWGTITSEPGSGGDVANTRATASPDGDGTWRLTGQKHFGSGSGITSYMLTSAVPEGEADPDWFFLDVGDVPWDGSAGMKLVAPWDGHGMIATQSHGMAFEGFPASRFASGLHWKVLADAAAPFVATIFTAVIAGIVEAATAEARAQLEPKQSSLRAYELVEWSRAEAEAWLVGQAFEGMLRAVETKPAPLHDVLQGKAMVAELAETVLRRLCRVVGGGTFARRSPLGFWFEDVRALGFLRPPWGLAYDAILARAPQV